MGVFPGRGTSATLSTQSWEIWKATLVVTCGHDLWLPPGERRSFPGKFTGFFSQTEHSVWFPEVTVPQLGMQDFPLASCLYLCRAKSGGWSLAEASRIHCKTVHTHLAMFMGGGAGVGITIMRPLRKIFSEVVFQLNCEGKRGGSNAHAL